jgi:hypothetical protein
VNHSATVKILAALLAIAGTTKLHAATSKFCDKFTTKIDTNWGNQRGAWQIAKKKYYATAPNNSPPTYTDLTALQNLQNFTVTATVNDVYDGGIWLRSNYNGGAVNGILLVVGGAYSNYNGLYWHVVTNGNFAPPVNEANVPNLEGSNAKIKIVVKGSSYKAMIGGKVITTLTDTTFTTGSTGLYDFSTAPQETFSNFCVTY